jgi:hypothetical protein
MGMVDKRRTLRRIAVLNVGSLAFWFRVTESEAAVIEALQQQDNVSKRVVDGKNNLVVVSKILWARMQAFIP